ncbi:MAG: alkaline phosphatase D family protein [Verrucomicrobiota bacterium]
MRASRSAFWKISFLLVALVANALASATPLERVAIGSCNKESLPQPLWEPIVAFRPQLWIWLGDNVYGDTHDMKELAAKYALQKSNTGYQKLLATCPVEGIWDDHDYGTNDSGFKHPRKRESQKLFLDFVGEPAEVCSQYTPSFIHIFSNLLHRQTEHVISYCVVVTPVVVR